MPARPHIIAGLFALVAVAPMRYPALRAPTAAHADAVPDGTFEGAWREAQVRLTRRGGAVIVVHPIASLYVATGTHYSRMATLAASDSTRVPACDRFWGHSGRYRLTHDTLTLYPMVGRDARLAAGDSIRFHVRASGDTLWLSGRFSEHYLPVDGPLVPDTAGPFVAQEILLMRVATGAAPTRSQGSRPVAPLRVDAVPNGTYSGVWREVEVRVVARDSSVHVVHQDPSLFLATGTHYSKMAVLGNGDTATANLCDVFWGNAGRYELSRDTLTYYPIVARDRGLPNAEKAGERYLVKARGDTLWMKWINGPFPSHETWLVRVAR
jgi:hypothetical protein